MALQRLTRLALGKHAANQYRSKKMKNWIVALCVAGALATTTTVGVLAQVSTRPGPPKTQIGRRERHPELRRALAALERAQTDLQRSARDFHGHRAKAAE